MLYPALNLLSQVCDVLGCLRLQWYTLGGDGASGLLDTCVHSVCVAMVGVSLYP